MNLKPYRYPPPVRRRRCETNHTRRFSNVLIYADDSDTGVAPFRPLGNSQDPGPCSSFSDWADTSFSPGTPASTRPVGLTSSFGRCHPVSASSLVTGSRTVAVGTATQPRAAHASTPTSSDDALSANSIYPTLTGLGFNTEAGPDSHVDPASALQIAARAASRGSPAPPQPLLRCRAVSDWIWLPFEWIASRLEQFAGWYMDEATLFDKALLFFFAISVLMVVRVPGLA